MQQLQQFELLVVLPVQFVELVEFVVWLWNKGKVYSTNYRFHLTTLEVLHSMLLDM
jgi:hypothetical protein